LKRTAYDRLSGRDDLPWDLALQMFEVYDIIKTFHLNPHEDNLLFEGAIEGMVGVLNDKYSDYISSEKIKRNTKNYSSTNEAGIGVSTVASDDNNLLVTEVFKWSSAKENGIARFDKIVKINNVLVKELGHEASIHELYGKELSTVRVEISRLGEENFECVIARKKFKRQLVYPELLLENRFGLIRLLKFEGNADVYFKKAIEELLEHKIRGLLIDLRNNIGGQINLLASIANIFLPEGLMFLTRDNLGREQKYYADKAQVIIPLTILVNQHTGSSAEMFSSILRQRLGTKIIGVPTVGKGVAGETFELSDGAMLTISTTECFSSENKSLNRQLIPDYLINEAPDIELLHASFYLQKDDYINKGIEILMQE